MEDLHYFPKGQSVDRKYAESTGFMRPVKPKICRKEIRAPRSGVVVLYDQHNRPTDRLLRRHVLHSLLGQLFRCVTVIHSISKKEKGIIRHIRRNCNVYLKHSLIAYTGGAVVLLGVVDPLGVVERGEERAVVLRFFPFPSSELSESEFLLSLLLLDPPRRGVLGRRLDGRPEEL